MRRGLQDTTQLSLRPATDSDGGPKSAQKASITMKQLTQDQFEDQFTVVDGPDGPDGESIRDDYDGIAADSKHLWTIVDADGSLYAVSGVQYVNRLGYIVTEEAWDEETEAVWHEASDEDEDDEELSGDA